MIHPVGGKSVTDLVKQDRTDRPVPGKNGAEPAEKTGVLVEIGKSSSPAGPVTYTKPGAKVDQETINRLWDETRRATENLRTLVERMIARQAARDRGEISGDELLPEDSEIRLEAARQTGPEGDWGAEAVSTRIVDFAVALSGGDRSRFEELKGAIEKGFQEAEKALGGTLPEVSRRTYDLVMDKLEAWASRED